MNEKIHKNFQKIYLFLSIAYIVFIPLFVMILKCLNNDTIILSTWHGMTIFISLFVITTFLFEIVIDRNNIRKIKTIKYILIFFLLFFMCAIISTILSNNPTLSLFGDLYRGNGLVQVLSYIGYALLGILLNKTNRIKVLRIVAYVSFILALLNTFGNNNIYFVNYYSNSAIFYHFNHYGYYLVYTIIITIFLFFYDEDKILKISDFIIYITLIYTLIINNTFGCYIAVLFSIIFIFIYCLKKKILFQYLFIIIPFILLSAITKVNNDYLVYNNFKNLFYDIGVIKNEIENNDLNNIEDSPISYIGTNRGELWIHGVKFIKKKPIFGYGLDNLGEQYAKYNIYMDMPHNLIINLSATIGVPGMLCYFIAITMILIKGIKKYKTKDHISNLFYFVILGHLISSMFGNTMYYVTPYYVIILGMGMLDLNEDISKD